MDSPPPRNVRNKTGKFSWKHYITDEESRQTIRKMFADIYPKELQRLLSTEEIRAGDLSHTIELFLREVRGHWSVKILFFCSKK